MEGRRVTPNRYFRNRVLLPLDAHAAPIGWHYRFVRHTTAAYNPTRLMQHGPPMTPSLRLDQHREAIRRVVADHHALNPRVFGSVSRGEDTEDSDLDLLVDPAEGMSLFDIGAMRWKLRNLLGIEVDVVSARGLSGRLREVILTSAVPV